MLTPGRCKASAAGGFRIFILAALAGSSGLAADGDLPDSGPGRPGASPSFEAFRISEFLAPPEEKDARPAEEDVILSLPLHAREGAGGWSMTLSANLVNPAEDGKFLGKPSIGLSYAHLGHGKSFEAYTITETLFDRIELGYGFNTLDVGDLFEDMEPVFGVRPEGHSLKLHNLNARFLLTKEGEYKQEWLPAINLGFHFKFNQDIEDLDDDLGGQLESAVGIKDDKGVDYTLYASKTFEIFSTPLVVNLGLRSTESARMGLLGFTGDREIVPEGSVYAKLSDRFAVAFEYRRMPDEYNEIPDLINGSDDTWAVSATYNFTHRLNLAVGYGHLGHVFNHTANRSLGLAIKYEF